MPPHDIWCQAFHRINIWCLDTVDADKYRRQRRIWTFLCITRKQCHLAATANKSIYTTQNQVVSSMFTRSPFFKILSVYFLTFFTRLDQIYVWGCANNKDACKNTDGWNNVLTILASPAVSPTYSALRNWADSSWQYKYRSTDMLSWFILIYKKKQVPNEFLTAARVYPPTNMINEDKWV